MGLVAETLRRDSEDRLRSMTPGERVAEALALGRRAIAWYAAANGVSPEEARRRFERGSQIGRRPSRVARALADGGPEP